MNYDIEEGVVETKSLPENIVEAVKRAIEVFRTDSSYTDKRNEFAAAVISKTTGKVYAGGNFLSVNSRGQVESKECAEGTALAVGRSMEGQDFALGAAVILNRVHDDASNNGQTFGPCDRCRSNLIASALSIADRRNAKKLGETAQVSHETLSSIPVISGVYDEASELGCDEVLVIALDELSQGDSICYDNRNMQTAIPLFVVHNAPRS